MEDFFIDQQSYFPTIEAAAAVLRTRIEAHGGTFDRALEDDLAEHHGIGLTRSGPGDKAAQDMASPDHAPADADDRLVDGHLVLAESDGPETARFRIAQFIFEHEHPDLLRAVTADPRLTGDDARGRARRAMARYGAGAILFPYAPFLAAAEAARLAGVTRARMTQIANLLLLAPEIQEAILQLPPVLGGEDLITERDLRKLAAQMEWSIQVTLWTALLQRSKSPSAA